MNITDINLFKRLKKSPLQKEIDLLNSNLNTVETSSFNNILYIILGKWKYD